MKPRSNDPGMYNMQVVEFINSQYVQKEVFPDEETFKKGIIDKLNGIAQESSEHFTAEKYELRFNREKDPKYIQLRCT